MRFLAVLLLCAWVPWDSTRAGTATYSNQVGAFFAFKNMSEVGGTNVPPGLQEPRLFTSPYDTIKFSPSTYVVVENNGSSLKATTNSSVLTLMLESVASRALQELQISVSGSYATTFYQASPTGIANVGLSLGLDLTYGANTVGGFVVPITQDATTKTWSGFKTFTASDLSTIFSQPSLQVQQLVITATPSVTAEAQWANARSQISYLDFTVIPIPEPSSLHLLAGGILLGLLRRGKKQKNH